MKIIAHKKIFLTISGLLVAAAIVALIFWGLTPGIDFVGGTSWQVRSTPTAVGVTKDTLIAFVRGEAKLEDATVLEQSDGSFIVRAKEISEADHAAHLAALQAKFGGIEELRFETIGAAVGQELKSKAVTTFILVLVGISLYITFAFRKVSYPVKSWKYGVITLVTLFHDAIIPIGALALFGYLFGAEMNIAFVVAILVVIGFSVHDTIVVFDRIRENLRQSKAHTPDEFDALVNRSVNETFARSVNTSLTLVLVLIALFLLGAPDLRFFVAAILIGTVVGTYSSIFVASPLLTIWRRSQS